MRRPDRTSIVLAVATGIAALVLGLGLAAIQYAAYTMRIH